MDGQSNIFDQHSLEMFGWLGYATRSAGKLTWSNVTTVDEGGSHQMISLYILYQQFITRMRLPAKTAIAKHHRLVIRWTGRPCQTLKTAPNETWLRKVLRLRRLEVVKLRCEVWWKEPYLEDLVYHFFRQLWLVLGVKLMEINSNWFSR